MDATDWTMTSAMDTISPSSSSRPSGTPSSDRPQPHQGVKKRPYQTRRKERSCDNCKLRKTKCDAHEDKPCTACINAKLDCRFSSTEHEGRKIGPQRKIRDLERLVDQLQKRLRETQQSLDQNQRENVSRCSTPGSNLPNSISDSNSTVSYPMPESAPETSLVGREPADARVPGLSKRQKEREPMAWNPNAFGPGSAPQFVESYSEYLQRLGFSLGGVGIHHGNIIQSAPAVPLLSDYISTGGGFNFIPMDLRAFLPKPAVAFQILEVFRRSVQVYKAPFYWPHIIEKFTRAFQEPLMENDGKAVGMIFCPVMMLLAVGSQLVAADEIKNGDTGQEEKNRNLPQERQGWKYFELGRKFLGLNNPVYTLEDAMVLVLMSLYLDKATLPSPCWMICGAMSRVCQDIGLHRVPPKGIFDPIQLESRARLFWLAYVQDKRVSMKMGRPFMLRAEDCDVPHPGTYEYSGIKRVPDDIDESGGRSQFPAGELKNVDYISRHALETTHAIINGSKVFEDIQSLKLTDGGSDDIARLQDIDNKLLRAWNQLPSELRDYEREEELDVPAARSLFIIQHSRLILFRHFTDFSKTHPITDQLRTFCLQQSVQISKITARIIHRLQLDPRFMDTFGVRTDDLAHLHTFRAAVILLWGEIISGEGDKQPIADLNEDLRICLVALDSIARVHLTGRRFLQLYKEFARLFGHPTASFDTLYSATYHTKPIQDPDAGFPQPDTTWTDQGVSWEAAVPEAYNNQVSSKYFPEVEQARMGYSNMAVSDAPSSRIGAVSAPAVIVDPDNVPTIMSQVRNGDWNSFQDLLAWDPMFETTMAGGNIWNFREG